MAKYVYLAKTANYEVISCSTTPQKAINSAFNYVLSCQSKYLDKLSNVEKLAYNAKLNESIDAMRSRTERTWLVRVSSDDFLNDQLGGQVDRAYVERMCLD